MTDNKSKDTSDESIEESFLETVVRSDLKDACADLSEVALDSVLKDGLLKDIPIVGVMAKLVSAVGTVRDQLFLKKLYKFYAALDRIPPAEREKQIAKVASDPKERQQVGEHLLLLLERLNHMGKPELLARAFQALLEGKINRRQFDGLAYAIEGLVMGDIGVFVETFRDFGQDGPPQWDERFAGLHHCGLLTIRLAMTEGVMHSEGGIKQRIFEPRYHLTAVGNLFHQLIIQRASAAEG